MQLSIIDVMLSKYIENWGKSLSNPGDTSVNEGEWVADESETVYQ